MSREKVSRNASCPCGSGKKYKRCCWNKQFTYNVGPDGDVIRSVPMSDEAREVLEDQRRRFIERFGREPGPDDPVFFDLPPEEEMKREVRAAMDRAGIDPALAYAYEKTGLIVTRENQGLIPDKDLAEWEAAVEEYKYLHRDSRS